MFKCNKITNVISRKISMNRNDLNSLLIDDRMKLNDNFKSDHLREELMLIKNQIDNKTK